MKITLINPPLISQPNDPHTGIIYMPFMMAYLSSYLKKKNYLVQIVDAFGEAPDSIRKMGIRQIQGLKTNQILGRIDLDTKVIFIYFCGVVASLVIKEIVKEVKKAFPRIICVLFENSQAVTGISLRHEPEQFLNLGVDVILYGEPEKTSEMLIESINNKTPFPEKDGFIFYKDGTNLFKGDGIPLNKNLDDLPFPDWSSFPLENYWSIGYAHGPMKNPYLTLLTSRGCPLPCAFCVVPSLNNKRWRARSAENVVNEIEYFNHSLGISDFHIEDVNPTVSSDRIVKLCKEILDRGLKVDWKFVSGTKIETMKIDTIPLLAKAGCRFISFSPETGSARLLKTMKKPFNYDLAYDMTKLMHKTGIFSQACFILGFPGENQEDIKETSKYIRKLTFAGVDEIAIFIVTPIPGTAIFDEIKGYEDFSQLTFSPTWRKDYKYLRRQRLRLYIMFIILKGILYPHKIIRHLINIPKGHFDTKLEQAFYRISFWHLYNFFRQKFKQNDKKRAF